MKLLHILDAIVQILPYLQRLTIWKILRKVLNWFCLWFWLEYSWIYFSLFIPLDSIQFSRGTCIWNATHLYNQPSLLYHSLFCSSLVPQIPTRMFPSAILILLTWHYDYSSPYTLHSLFIRFYSTQFVFIHVVISNILLTPHSCYCYTFLSLMHSLISQPLCYSDQPACLW